MDQHVRPERREGIVGVQGQADARQSQIAFAVQVLQIDADRRAHLLVQVALQRARQLDLLALRRQGAPGRDVAVAHDPRPLREVLQRHPAAGRIRRHGGYGDHAARQGRQRRIDLGALGQAGHVSDQVERRAPKRTIDVALALEDGAVALVVQVERPARATFNAQHIVFELGGRAPALRRRAILHLGGQRAEVRLQHDVHHPLVGAVAVGQRRLFRQDVEAIDGLRRQAANFLKARDAAAVDQKHGRAAARAAGLALQQRHQLADAGGAEGLELG